MKLLYYANSDWYLYNFRLSLIRQMQDNGHELLLVSPPGEYAEKLTSMGFRWKQLQMNRRSVNPLTEVTTLYQLVKIYRAERPDIVHHFTLKCVIYGMIASFFCEVSGKVNAITGFGYVFTGSTLRSRLLRPVVQTSLRLLFRLKNCHIVVQNCDDYKQIVESRFVGEDRLHLIRGSGVNIDKFSQTTHPDRIPVKILLATRLLGDKGIYEYVAAARHLLEKRGDVRFFLAGRVDEGNPTSVSEEELTAWNNIEGFSVLGHTEEMAELLADMDIVVLPSYREGLPRILLEAAACGLPLVTTDVPGCREVVKDGVNGLLVPPRDDQALAVAIESLIDSSEKREQMGVASRERVVSHFDEKIVLNETVNLYNQIEESGE